MAKIERTYSIPLRKEIMKASRYRRAEKAIIGVKNFLRKNMKSDNVKLGKYLNLYLWSQGIRNPPHTVRVLVTKEDDEWVVTTLGSNLKKVLEIEGVAVDAIDDRLGRERARDARDQWRRGNGGEVRAAADLGDEIGVRVRCPEEADARGLDVGARVGRKRTARPA